jgi:4-alpha-glucanotransferase
VQWVAEEQWQAFRRTAHQQGVKIIGDVPFFVRADSVAVWSQPHLFSVHENGQVKNGVGAPPDAFAKDGQWWGNPAYEWSAHASSKFLWWQRRVAWAASKYDALRLDHFHGYLRTWTISGRSRDPRHGTWSPTPSALLSIIRSIPVPVIVEDLGAFFPEAELVRKKLGVLGTRVFEFGWNGFTNNPHALDAVTPDSAYYTSTHDLPPLRRWLKMRKYRNDVARIRERLGTSGNIVQAVQSVLASPATITLFPMGDIVSRPVPPINTPGTSRGNWRWQLRSDDLDSSIARTLRSELRAAKRFLV